jgi:phenylalanyl-tRNA synthetase beta chain
MRVPVFWLDEYCKPGISVTELEHRLTMTGTKVEGIHTHGVAGLEHFLVGRVLSAERHPDADRLTVCTVDVGDGDARTIVCGAPNVAAGQIVAVAEPGAVPTTTGSWCSTASSRRARRWSTCCRSPPTCSSWRSRRTGPTA